jgi:hypothetical protein
LVGGHAACAEPFEQRFASAERPMAFGRCVTNTLLKEEVWRCTRDEGRSLGVWIGRLAPSKFSPAPTPFFLYFLFHEIGLGFAGVQSVLINGFLACQDNWMARER